MQSSISQDPSRFVRRETELHSEIQAMKLESSPVTKDLTLGRKNTYGSAKVQEQTVIFLSSKDTLPLRDGTLNLHLDESHKR